jgi:hypothetical protein
VPRDVLLSIVIALSLLFACSLSSNNIAGALLQSVHILVRSLLELLSLFLGLTTGARAIVAPNCLDVVRMLLAERVVAARVARPLVTTAHGTAIRSSIRQE